MKKKSGLYFLFLCNLLLPINTYAQEVSAQKETVLTYETQLVAKGNPLEPKPGYIYKEPLSSPNKTEHGKSFLPKTGSEISYWMSLLGIVLLFLSWKKGGMKHERK
ncbi:LPXTG cell wall anchor domain-containing protein [Enterococcus faecium]|nr:LPXTG cell wall anchor domain-containing protein [Enterococcus faecium]